MTKKSDERNENPLEEEYEGTIEETIKYYEKRIDRIINNHEKQIRRAEDYYKEILDRFHKSQMITFSMGIAMNYLRGKVDESEFDKSLSGLWFGLAERIYFGLPDNLEQHVFRCNSLSLGNDNSCICDYILRQVEKTTRDYVDLWLKYYEMAKEVDSEARRNEAITEFRRFDDRNTSEIDLMKRDGKFTNA